MRPALKEKTVVISVFARAGNKFKEKFEMLKADAQFKAALKDFREKWQVDIGKQKSGNLNKRDLKIFLKKFGLGEEWEDLISHYITTNTFQELYDPHGIKVKWDSRLRYADMRVYPETTIREIKKAHASVAATLRKGKRTRIGNAPKSERDIYIYELHQKRKTYKEISRIVNENYGELLDAGHLSRNFDKIKKRRARL